MQFARAGPEQLRLLRIDAADQFLEERTGGRVFDLQIRFAFQDALVIAADGIERELPGVPFTGHSRLQETNHRGLGFSPAIFDRAGERGHMRESAPFGQESRDFDIGIHAVLEFAIELEEIFVLEEHRGITLLDAEHLGGRDFIPGRQRAGRHTEQFAGVSFQVLALRDGTEELLAKRRIPDRVMESASSAPANRAMRPARCLAIACAGSRSRIFNGRISLRRAILVSHFEEPKRALPSPGTGSSAMRSSRIVRAFAPNQRQ